LRLHISPSSPRVIPRLPYGIHRGRHACRVQLRVSRATWSGKGTKGGRCAAKRPERQGWNGRAGMAGPWPVVAARHVTTDGRDRAVKQTAVRTGTALAVVFSSPARINSRPESRQRSWCARWNRARHRRCGIHRARPMKNLHLTDGRRTGTCRSRHGGVRARSGPHRAHSHLGNAPSTETRRPPPG
jgi:hypothetical protein